MSVDIDRCLESAWKRQILSQRVYIALADMAIEVLLEEPNVVVVQTPVTICGDIHGQFYDLLQLFKMGGQVPKTKYVFMGDYVDRGHYSLETFLLLICLKIKYPDRITLLRGNHETRQITQSYGFFDDCMKRYGDTMPYLKTMEVFDCLPIAALVNDEILCVHGGLSPDAHTLDQIQLIHRREEVPMEGPFSDFMWSDPVNTISRYEPSSRGAGYLFGHEAAKEFIHLNGLSLVCRAHQLVMEGYKHFFIDASVVTVWSAPNYCYRSGNVAAILQLDDALEQNFILFAEVPPQLTEVPARQTIPYFM